MLASLEGFELPNFVALWASRVQSEALRTFLQEWDMIIFSVLIALIIIAVFRVGASKKQMVPRGLQNMLELFIDGIRLLVVNVLGPKGEPYIPLMGTLFIYLLGMNLFGLVPYMASPTANINITLAQAICIFILVQYLNIRNMGVKGFLYHMAGSPKGFTGWIMVPLMFPIELLTQISRPITLAFRLFGNIFGEDVLIAYFTIAGATILPFLLPFGLPIQLPILLFGIFTALVQSLVFTLLATVYILLSIPEEEHGTHGG